MSKDSCTISASSSKGTMNHTQHMREHKGPKLISLSNFISKMNSDFAEVVSKKHHGIESRVSPLFGDCYVFFAKAEIFLISMGTQLHSRYQTQVAIEK